MKRKNGGPGKYRGRTVQYPADMSNAFAECDTMQAELDQALCRAGFESLVAPKFCVKVVSPQEEVVRTRAIIARVRAQAKRNSSGGGMPMPGTPAWDEMGCEYIAPTAKYSGLGRRLATAR